MAQQMPTSSPVPTPSADQTVHVDAATAADNVSANQGNNKKISATTKFSSMEELRKKYPQLYLMMMQGSVTTFIGQQNASLQRIHEANRRANDGG